MDPRDLKSASKYVNNMLSSRGLLRGDPIEFHRPTRDDGTPARIINLVHELITRRDRDAEQRENLAITVRSLRDLDAKHSLTTESLKTRNAELERDIAVLQSRNRALTSNIRTAEASAKSLRDETVRLKSLISQVRTQAANDVRKKDLQLAKMKERLLDTRRGTGARSAMSQVVVTGATTGLGGSTSSRDDSPGPEAHSIAQDTADFLTQLSQNLSDENDNLVALLRQSLSNLRAIQGLPDDIHVPDTEDEAIEAGNPVTAPPATYEQLGDQIESALQSLKELLNQPDYVPIEELEERDALIVQLTQRNETLQEEWKKAIDLVDGWNKTLAGSRSQEGEGGEVQAEEQPPLVDVENGKGNQEKERDQADDGTDENTHNLPPSPASETNG